MGKKKPKQQDSAAATTNSNASKPAKATKKKYKFSPDQSNVEVQNQSEDELQKVHILPSQETAVLDLILRSQEELGRNFNGSASSRLTSKKLTDMYISLAAAGFRHNQIEQAMTCVVQYGGDLSAALDWLCLNTPNGQLPEGFFQSFSGEEQKKKRDAFTAQATGPERIDMIQWSNSIRQEIQPADAQPGDSNSVKDWVLQYSQQSDEDSDLCSDSNDLETDLHLDPNEQYLELTAKLLDARNSASDAKSRGDKSSQKEASTQIRELTTKRNVVENHPLFNPAVKIPDIDQVKEAPASVPPDASMTPPPEGATEEEGDLGLSFFEEQAAAPEPKAAAVKSIKAKTLDERCFEYTTQQWTGKSPKQFLIDWVRKNLPKSPAPSFSKVPVSRSLWRCRVQVQRKEGALSECPDIVTRNMKEAEHLAATLALYRLCKGQRVYQLLPQPYRDVWLEWADAEEKCTADAKAEQNKPRDQFVTRLMKKLAVTDSSVTMATTGDEDEGDADTWEDLASDEEEVKPSKVAPSTDHPCPHKPITPAASLRILHGNRQSPSYTSILQQRQTLPVFCHREAVTAAIIRHSVVVIAGETGSGKSTQIPQFILEHCLEAGQSCDIVCTEPRRISAVSLATRVSQELGERDGPGGRNSLTGYSIRLETRRSAMTRLTYCTTGVLLRRIQNDPELRQVSHVIVDEVHERSVESDFLMLSLRRLLNKRPRLKVILMSATLDSAKFSSYFQHCPVMEIPGRTFPVQELFVEDVVEITGYTLEEGSRYAANTADLIQEVEASIAVSGQRGQTHTVQTSWSKDDLYSIDKTDLDGGQYTLKTRNIVTRMHRSRINLELIVKLLIHLDTDSEYSHIDGAVLVFLPGLSHIQELYEMLNAEPHFSDNPRYKIIALHSVLSSRDQTSAFDVPPAGTRKVVLATNIAETGITIPDVVFVVDCGKVKENRYVESCQMSQLKEVFISRASARQRQGRAGRVREGYCFRLYTNARSVVLVPHTVPEILRVPLEELCLHIMKCDLGHPAEFLSEALDPPNPLTVARAISVLREVGACEQCSPKLTPLGQHLAGLPVHVRIGKMLVYAAVLGCLQPMSVIAAAMSDKSPFVAPLDKRHLANEARNKMTVFNSDHLTLYKAYLGWKNAQKQGRRSEIEYCERNFLRRATLIDIENTSQDLYQLVCAAGFEDIPADQFIKRTKKQAQPSKTDVIKISQTPSNSSGANLSQNVATILKAVLTAGLYPHLAQLFYTKPVDHAVSTDEHYCVGQTAQGAVHVHPTSVNRNLGANGWLVFQEKVKTARVYLRDTTLVSSYPVLLFGGSLAVQHKEQVIVVDDWIKFKAYAKTAVIFKELRMLLDNLLEKKLENPRLDLTAEGTVLVLVDLLLSEKSR